MTERLSTLLRHEADGVDVPVPDTDRIIGTGRRQRRRRAAAQVGAGAAVLAIALTGGVLALGGDDAAPGRHRSDLPPASAAQLDGWAVASGSTVQLGSGRTVKVDGTVKSVYYTSAGVLVRYGATATTDAPDSTYALIGDDGSVSDFSLELGDRVPGTDPTQPYLVYAEATDRPDRWDVVVRDVRTGEVARTIRVAGDFTWGGWQAPPVSLSGSHVYVGIDGPPLDVDLGNGEVTESPLQAGLMPSVHGGREVVVDDGANTESVVDAQTGEVLLEVSQRDGHLSLSPDGRHAVATSMRICEDDGSCRFEDPTATVYDLATGARSEIDVNAAGYGWTPEGDLLRITDEAVDVCDPVGDACRSTPIEIGGASLRVGGTSYEV